MRNFSTKISNFSSINTILDDLSNHPLHNYILQGLETSLRQIKKLEENGVELSTEDVGNLSTYFFESGQGYYIGIESNLPSTYYEMYPNYLSDNEKYLKKLTQEERKQTKRILIAQSGSDIRTDALMHPQLYKQFIEWHEKNNVELFWIESDKAEKISASFQIQSTNLGLWEKTYAVTFIANAHKHSVRIKLLRSGTNSFNNAVFYAKKILKEANLLPIESDKIPVTSKELVQRWEDYAGKRAFRERGIGSLLLKELSPKSGWGNGRVLDAAAGSGYEARLLAAKGYDVTANELDPSWNKILVDSLTQDKLPVETYQYDWRILNQYLKPLYTAVIAIGNSLSMAIGKTQRAHSIKQFYSILKPGGKLIIDERNFPLILKQLSLGAEYSAKNALYNCEKVDAKLSLEDKSSDLIRFTFFDIKTKRELGSIMVQALPKNELRDMLKEVGFRSVKIYSDLIPGENPNAKIYTYVATK